MQKISTYPIQIFLIFLVLIGIKATGLWAYGPIMTPDSSGYTAYADIILSNRDWLSQSTMRGSILAFRSIGYPMVIATARIIAGDAWMWLIIYAQLILSLIASLYVFRLTKHLSGHLKLALFAAFCHGIGQTIVLDQCILTDSLNASFLLILSCHVGLAILDRRKPSLFEVGGLGCLVLAAFLMREAGDFLQYLLWPLIVYWGIASGLGKFRAVILVLIFAMPMLMGTQAYKYWNEVRTGNRFITTGAQTAMFFPMLELERRGTHVFAQDELLKDMEPFGPWDITTLGEQATRINAHLYSQHGFDDIDVARYAMNFFFQTWRDYPVDMAIVTLSQLRAKQSVLAFMPVEAVVQLREWATGNRPWPAKGTLWKAVFEDGRIDQLALVTGRGISRGVSMVILLAFLIGAPLLFLREVQHGHTKIEAYDVTISLMFLYWLIYLGYTSAYVLVHLETRYLMPAEPLSMVAGLAVTAALWQKYTQRWTAQKAIVETIR